MTGIRAGLIGFSIFAAGLAIGNGLNQAGPVVPPAEARPTAQAQPNSQQTPQASQAPLTGDEQTVIRVARQVTPAVVSIIVPNYGSGSGVVIRKDGMVLTNAHVVGAARTVQVGLADGRTVT